MNGSPTIPLVIRGRIYNEDLLEFGSRFEGDSFLSPDVTKHLGSLSLTDPDDMRDVYELSTSDVIDYLVELGANLDCDSNPHLVRARELSYRYAPTTAPIVDEQYRALPTIFARPLLDEMVAKGIGREYLDGWVSEQLADGRMLDVRAFGSRCVHIVAGNSPILSGLTVIRNALTRGDAVIKSPSNDPLTAAAVAMTMCEIAPDHPLTQHVSAAYWRGGDETVERELYQPSKIEKIVAWGGFASIKHVTRYLQPGIELVSFDPKRSVSIIGADAFAVDETLQDAAERLAVDIGQLNQAACASARVVFVLCGTDDEGLARLRDLAARTHDALLALPDRISTSPKNGIAHGLRSSLAAARFDSDWFTVVGDDGAGAIVVSHLPEPVDFAMELNDRVANLVPIDSVADAIRHFDSYTQTVGVFPESLKDEIRDIAGLSGAQRVVSLGYACAPSFAGPQDAIEPLRRLCRWVVDERSSRSSRPLGEIFAHP